MGSTRNEAVAVADRMTGVQKALDFAAEFGTAVELDLGQLLAFVELTSVPTAAYYTELIC